MKITKISNERGNNVWIYLLSTNNKEVYAYNSCLKCLNTFLYNIGDYHSYIWDKIYQLHIFKAITVLWYNHRSCKCIYLNYVVNSHCRNGSSQ